MQIKKTMKFIVKILVVILLVRGAILLDEENRYKPFQLSEEKMTANMDDRAQGNYVVYTSTNGIQTAPFIFGKSLYLYDVAKDKSYLIKNQKAPLGDFGVDVCFLGEEIMIDAGICLGDPPTDTHLFSINGRNCDVDDENPVVSCRALTESAIYSLDRDSNTIYKTDRTSGKMETVLEREMTDEDDGELDFAIFQDLLIAMPADGKSFIVKNLETNQEKEFFTPEDDFLLGVLPDVKGNFLLFSIEEDDADTAETFSFDPATTTEIFSFNPDTGESTKLLEWPHGICRWKKMENSAFHENHLFFQDYDGNIIQANLKTKKADVLIDCASIGTDISSYEVGYCDDYIVLEVWFNNNGEKELQVFDYQGNKLRVKKLKEWY